MLAGASVFNRPLSFDTSSVKTMGYMFREAYAFNQLLSFDTSSVKKIGSMFREASAFNQQLSFDTSSVTTMSEMFYGASAFNQPLSFDTSKVTTMSGMFQVRSFPCPVPNLQSSPRTLHRLCTHSAPARRRSVLRPCPRTLTLFCPKPELYYSCSAPCKCLNPKIMQRAPFSLSFGAP